MFLPHLTFKNALLAATLLAQTLLVSHAAQAQQLPPLPANLAALKPVDIFPTDAARNYTFNDGNKATTPSVFEAKKQGEQTVFSTEVFIAKPSHYNVQSAWKSGAPVQKGDVLLARLAIRAVYAKQESGDAVVNFYVQQAQPPHEKSVIIEISGSPEWKVIEIPFTATTNMAAGEGGICFSYGALAQKVEIAGLQVLNFGNRATLAQLPTTRFTYAGREENAEWRKQALKRIEEIRMAPLNIQVTDAKGRPVPGAQVSARLVQNEFLFGTAVSVDELVAAGPGADIYKDNLKALFNTVTIDNNLKWEPWTKPDRRAKTMVAMDWIEHQGFRLRGHNLVWPSKKFSPEFVKRQTPFGLGLQDSIRRHIRSIVTATKGKVVAWDVINEMLHENDYFTVMPAPKRPSGLSWPNSWTPMRPCLSMNTACSTAWPARRISRIIWP